MIVIVTGGTGLVGQALGLRLSAQAYKLVLPARRPEKALYPCRKILWPGFDAPFPLSAFPKKGDYGWIHLLGEPVASWPWTKARREKIRFSRTEGTKRALSALKNHPNRPRFFLAATALGIYGERAGEIVTEKSPISRQGLFLQELCREWEEEALKASSLCRTALFRLAHVLSFQGGFLNVQARFLKAGIRPLVLSKNPCWLSWIALEDLLDMILWAVENPSVKGIYNAASPRPVSLRDFYKSLARSRKFPALPLPLPLSLMRRAGGEMTKNLLASCRVLPEKALREGFVFQKENLADALRCKT